MGSKAKQQAPAPLPENWPAHIAYLTAPRYSPGLTPTHFAGIRAPPDPSDPLPEIPRHLKPGPCPAVRIAPITDPNHPAHGQAGLFATRDLAPGELILPYLGEVHVGTAPFGLDNNKNDHNDNNCSGGHESYDFAASDYDLWLDRDADVAVDAARAGNEARFVNDYRGVPAGVPDFNPGRQKGEGKGKGSKGKRGPNAEFRVAWDARRGERCMAVYVLPAGKNKKKKGARETGIARGEEVLVSYGRGFWQGRRGREGEGDQEGEGDGGGMGWG